MEDRRDLFREVTNSRKTLHLTMVAPYGLKPNDQASKVQSIVTLDDLYK